MNHRVDCHCGWARWTTSRYAGFNLLQRHHTEVHGLGTDWFYRPAPWAAANQRCPWPRLRLFRWLP